MRVRLNIAPIKDSIVQVAFERIQMLLQSFVLFNFYCTRINLTLKASAYPATLLVGHSLGQKPTDVIQTYVSGGTATWNIDSFTMTQLSVTISAALTVRGFAGVYRSDL